MAKMETFTDKVDQELKKMADQQDQKTTGNLPPKKEVSQSQKEESSGGSPKAKTPEEMNENPKDKINPEVVSEMAADS